MKNPTIPKKIWNIKLKTIKVKKRLAQGLRKYIRRQKTIIRKTVRDKAEQDRMIKELLDRFSKK